MIIVMCKLSSLDGKIKKSFIASSDRAKDINKTVVELGEYKDFKNSLPENMDFEFSKIVYDLYIDKTGSNLILDKVVHSRGILYHNSQIELTSDDNKQFKSLNSNIESE